MSQQPSLCSCSRCSPSTSTTAVRSISSLTLTAADINASATASYARILLIIVSIFNAARNSASFFLLCITCA